MCTDDKSLGITVKRSTGSYAPGLRSFQTPFAECICIYAFACSIPLGLNKPFVVAYF